MSSISSAKIQQADFLTLLTTQLRYQDPTSPVDQETFVSQLSQFSMLEGITKLNDGFEQMLELQELSQGVNLVGKEVVYQDSSGQLQSGRVDQISIAQGALVASVDGRSVSLSQIAAVTA